MSRTHRKKLIEVALPLDAINKAPRGIRGGRDSRGGFVHRFGSGLNANLHLHCATLMACSVPTTKMCNFMRLGGSQCPPDLRQRALGVGTER